LDCIRHPFFEEKTQERGQREWDERINCILNCKTRSSLKPLNDSFRRCENNMWKDVLRAIATCAFNREWANAFQYGSHPCPSQTITFPSLNFGSYHRTAHFFKMSFVCPKLQIVLMSTLCLMANPFNTKLYKSDANHSFSYSIKESVFRNFEKSFFWIHQLINQNYDVLHYI
jgi:hypothetical protein